MANFRQKKISRGQTLADKLSKARTDKNLSLEEVSHITKIQVKYLELLEQGDYKDLPGDIYAKSWIKLYGKFLGLNTAELLADYKIEKSVSERFRKVTEAKVPKKNASSFNILSPKALKVSGISLLIILVLLYFAWELNNIISPPKVLIFEPSNNFKTTESSVLIKGKTKAEVQMTINNEKVLLDEDGNFEQTVNLVVGLNNLQISAKKKHSKINNLELMILRENLNN